LLPSPEFQGMARILLKNMISGWLIAGACLSLITRPVFYGSNASMPDTRLTAIARASLKMVWTPLVCATFSGGIFASTVHAEDCHGLTGKTFGSATVIETDSVTPPFALASLGTSPGQGVSVDLPFCRVRGTIKPSPDSDIRFEVWLPARRSWNERFQGIGNGGFAGSLIYSGMAWALGAGYAVAASDTGHSGQSSESAWALGHPEKITDLGYRSIHETAVAAKAIIATYYGKVVQHSYYAGCSTGGRQGMVLAQRFPEDYDGIVAGAPAFYWPSLLGFDATVYRSMLDDHARWLSPASLALVNQTVLKACHASGGLIDDPASCHVDPAQLLCRPGQSGSCLSPSEVRMMKLMYGGIADQAGHSIYPGFTPGQEQSWTLWKLGAAGSLGRGSLAYPMPVGFFGNLVHQNPAWTLADFELGRDLAMAVDGPVGRDVFAENPDLRPFFARGGKLLQYHGWHDPAIPAQASIKYYQSVASRLGGTGDLDRSYRLFMGTGMYHCAGGPGPNAVGGVFGAPPPVRDPDHDVISALRRWVEDGVAPDRIIATHYRNNDPTAPVEGQRPWCAWPKAPHYSGGDRSLAASYSCVVPRS
jgi:hypothetical protein